VNKSVVLFDPRVADLRAAEMNRPRMRTKMQLRSAVVARLLHTESTESTALTAEV
jgi:hypothetical protein